MIKANFEPSHSAADGRLRARGWGLPLTGVSGTYNAITDVAGVSVGLHTIKQDAPKVVRTGVTAILPRPAQDLLSPVWAGCFSMNGNGEMTGTHWINEVGWFTGPITITNTLSLGMAHHGTVRWMVDRFGRHLQQNNLWILPVAAETYDGWLNDIYGLHITEEHVLSAINSAQTGAVPEGSVGGGTGMVAYEFKAGTGTASRRVSVKGEQYTVGVLVQANHGLRPWLTVCGTAVGSAMPSNAPWSQERGSIIVVVATDAPLLPIQLQRLARRAAIGIGRGGTPSGNNSGDIFLAFSTANNLGTLPEPAHLHFDVLGNDGLDSVFMGVVEAVDEAVLNSMLAADPCTGRDGRFVPALQGHKLAELLGVKSLG